MHPGHGVCDGDGALLPLSCSAVAGEDQRLANCCLVAAAANVNCTNGDHWPGCVGVGD